MEENTNENNGVNQLDSDENIDLVMTKLLKLISANPKGALDIDILNAYPELQPSEKAVAVNKLLSKNLITLFTQAKGGLIYKLKDQSTAGTSKGSDNEEKIVYSIIQEAGNKGIWIRDIRVKSNLNQTQLNKILKSLETKKFIKAVKSVAASKKKVYMLYNLEPDRSVTGGAWYQDQDFETEFVDILNQQCYRFLEQKSNNKQYSNGPITEKNTTYTSSNDVWKFISDLGISKVKLSIDDLEMILNTLVFDGKVEKFTTLDGKNMYRTINYLIDTPGYVKSPCGVCPVRKNCYDFGDVMPVNCQYLSDWLQ